MRCDVCDTKIPPGEDRCPNCGYRVRESSNAIHSQTISTEYPEPEIFKPKKKRKFYQTRSQTAGRLSQQRKLQSFKKYIIFIIALIVIGQGMALFVGNIVTDYNSHNYTEFTGESLQEGIDNGDDDGTLQLALDYENDLITFFTDELFKSFTTGMWELEQTLKYELRQHTIVKLLIMGLIDMILVFLMSIIVQPTLSISLLNILLYLLVPYNLICIILFSILTMWRNKMYNYVLWFASGSIGVAFILVTNIFNVYEQKIVYWAVTYLLTTIILGHIIYSQARTIRLEVA